MSDDWRLRVVLHEGGHVHKFAERLDASDLEHELEASFHDRLVVSQDGGELFCYAGARDQAEAAEKLVRSVAAEHGWRVDCELRHWHETAEQWEEPDVPLPQDDAQRAAEHAALIQSEREELEKQGQPEFEVRVQFDSHRDAAAFAERLGQEGLPAARRWKYLVVGAADQDSADALAARLRDEAPPGTTVTAEGSGKAAYDERPPNPFWFLGGLAG
jgi:hypothetical protein